MSNALREEEKEGMKKLADQYEKAAGSIRKVIDAENTSPQEFTMAFVTLFADIMVIQQLNKNLGDIFKKNADDTPNPTNRGDLSKELFN